MTTQVTTHTIFPGFFARIGTAIADAFVYLVENSQGARAALAAQRLFALSDEELAARGIRREEILSRTFGPRIHL
jgi:hypothetical protein